jgi:hypothetical protein
MKKYLLILLCSVSLLSAADTTLIRVRPPIWAKYKTTNRYGDVEYWATKPFMLYLDSAPGVPFAWASDTDQLYYDVVFTGVGSNPKSRWWLSRRKL